MKVDWAVTVCRDGEEVVTISANHLSGRDLSPEDEHAIRIAAQNLEGFVGPARGASEDALVKSKESTGALVAPEVLAFIRDVRENAMRLQRQYKLSRAAAIHEAFERWVQ